MASIPTETIDFPPGNSWSVQNREADVDYSLVQLLHAAITAGHDHNWRQVVGALIGGQMELLWKATAFLTTVRGERVRTFRPPTTGRARTRRVTRLVPTERFYAMDPSERRALTYHLGMTMATAWARRELRVPWLLHLDVYKSQLDPTLLLGNSRPDLVGRNLAGSWISVECKGRSSKPGSEAERKAKEQAQRIVDIGGRVPSLHLGVFSYFSPDHVAMWGPKPKVVTMRAIDPPSSEDAPEPIRLAKLNDHEFFRLYYEPWLIWFDAAAILEEEGPILWRHLKDLDLSLGITAKLKQLLDEARFQEVPKVMAGLEEKFRFADQYPDWAGDGILLKFGKSWTRMLNAGLGDDPSQTK